MSRYLFEYAYAGAAWALEVEAHDEAEARSRVAAFGSAAYRGLIDSKINTGPRPPLTLVRDTVEGI